ncbi:WGR domain-containing protein [Legionella drozanskii]|uniref:WGR domain-containing protein n=1 Tax=Legionella drozanskii LLAP-1 TaxID=1212489 RepID=A0A0W0SM32_9GAMM|nr:WGR domain-containing protein [Legionella drozanskii]KTC84364.1 hypothetical protein Ldro_2967 [Legionella drozanskii LLAP-1]
MLYLFSPFWFKHLLLNIEPYHYLRFEKDSRYYELRLTQDLLNDWILITSNGRIKSKLGQSRTQAFNTFGEALTQLYSAIKLRHQRQYNIARYLIEDLIYFFILLHHASHFASKRKGDKERKKSTSLIVNKNKWIMKTTMCSKLVSFFNEIINANRIIFNLVVLDLA